LAKYKKKVYAIIDIETTGGMFKRDKITEIAIVLYDGEKILDQFDTLINPERSIPYEITRITGIDNHMVSDAPKFYEVAKKIVEMTEGAIFVAHNVRFDYSFIKEEFSRLGYTYTRKQLCTVRMARKAFPGLRSYSLGNLIKHFNIKVNARHRALDDTLATVTLFKHILHHSEYRDDIHLYINRGIREQKLPEAISIEALDNLPETTGVYYFHNSSGRPVYVGKSINIKKRVKQHFSRITAKSDEFIKQVKNISFEETGSELLALLLESEEIKNLQPTINKAQRTKAYPYFIHTFEDELGYLCFCLEKTSSKNILGKDIVSYFGSPQSGKATLSGLRETFELCESKLLVRNRTTDKCIFLMMDQCYGACEGLEHPENYNLRAYLAKAQIQKVFDEDFILLTNGRNEAEKGVILIEEHHYRGFGYINTDDVKLGVEELKEAIQYKRTNVECNGIINTYLQNNTDYEIIPV
jgi:DNA polymerase-3 subunit epsilon